jgi:hypothetical protein
LETLVSAAPEAKSTIRGTMASVMTMLARHMACTHFTLVESGQGRFDERSAKDAAFTGL